MKMRTIAGIVLGILAISAVTGWLLVMNYQKTGNGQSGNEQSRIVTVEASLWNNATWNNATRYYNTSVSSLARGYVNAIVVNPVTANAVNMQRILGHSLFLANGSSCIFKLVNAPINVIDGNNPHGIGFIVLYSGQWWVQQCSFTGVPANDAGAWPAMQAALLSLAMT